MWKAFNIYADIPDTPPPIPIDKVYHVLLKYWKEDTISYVSEGMLHLEFCEYDLTNCIWGEAHCQCKDYQDMYGDTEDSDPYPDPDALPF